MATLLLLNKPDKRIRGNDVGRTIMHLLHGLAAIENALLAFLAIISDPPVKQEGCAEVLGVFDAHVGDCACHMRAQMLWELIEHYRLPGKARWFEHAVAAVTECKMKAAALLAELRQKKGYVRKLGFGSLVTYAEIFDRIGFTGFLASLERSSDGSSDISESVLETPADPVSQLSVSVVTNDSVDVRQEFEPSKLECRPDALQAALNTIPARPAYQAHGHRAVDVDEWNPDDYLVIVRFLTVSRLLSLHKKVSLEPGPPACFRSRLDPELSYAESEKELALLDLGEGVTVSQLIVPAERVKRSALGNEHEAMQIYLSKLSTDWATKLVETSGFSTQMTSLFKQSVVVSNRHIACVPAFLSIVPIRAEWFARGTPIFVLIKRFCAKGYHNTFYRVTPNPRAWHPTSTPSDNLGVSLGESDWFDVRPVEENEVLSEEWAREAHFVLDCNSIDGTMGDFYNRLVDNGGVPNRPHEDACAEHEEYVHRVLESNFSRALMHCFGQHAQFPFGLPGGEDDFEVVAEQMRSTLGPEATDEFWRSVREAEEFGAGRSAQLFSVQHTFLEFPVVVGRQVEDMVKRKDRPAPFGYRFA